MAFDMQHFARRESMLAMAVNLPPLSSLPASSAPSAPSAAGPAAPAPLQRRRLPPPHPRPAPSSSSLQLPASSILAFFSDIASTSTSTSASNSAAAATSATVSVSASSATPAATSASAVSNNITTTYSNSISPTTPVRGQTRLPSFAAVTAAAAADSTSASSPLWPPLSPLDSSPSSASVSSSSYTLSHPVLPPLPVNLPQESSPTYLPWTSIHHHFPGLDPLVSLSAPLNTNANINSSGENSHSSNSNASNASSDADSSDTPAHFSTPSFNHFPALIGSQPLPFWPAYDNSSSLPSTWNESAHALDRFNVSTAINQAVIIAAGTPLPPLSSPDLPPGLPSHLPSPRPFAPQPRSDEAFLLQDFDIHSDIDADFGDRHRQRAENLRARARALASTLATFSATSASAAAATAQRPTAPRQRHHRAIQNLASPPALLDGFALPRTVTGAYNGIFDEPEDIPNFPFPFPLADAALPPLSSSSAIMPAASTARRRSRRQTITSETFDDPTSTSASTSPSTGAAHSNKRQRIVPLGADASQQIIDDDDDSLFGDSKPLQVEDYTTIDLTEATDVPEELKKPKVDNRTKLSSFQCVICMDDVTGLTLTHCGHLFCAQCLHSSLNIDSTRGKCPMCRSKIDMKARDNYTTKTKGYWPLELKLMTRTRQGKRKAQAMA
ncbi:hypothetical protein ACHAO4_001036 [Trichoderma viride]